MNELLLCQPYACSEALDIFHNGLSMFGVYARAAMASAAMRAPDAAMVPAALRPDEDPVVLCAAAEEETTPEALPVEEV